MWRGFDKVGAQRGGKGPRLAAGPRADRAPAQYSRSVWVWREPFVGAPCACALAADSSRPRGAWACVWARACVRAVLLRTRGVPAAPSVSLNQFCLSHYFQEEQSDRPRTVRIGVRGKCRVPVQWREWRAGNEARWQEGQARE